MRWLRYSVAHTLTARYTPANLEIVVRYGISYRFVFSCLLSGVLMFDFFKKKNKNELNTQRLLGRDDFLAALGRSGLVGNIGCNPYNIKTNTFTSIEHATHFAFYETDDDGNILSDKIVDSSLDAFLPSSDLSYARQVWDLIVLTFPKKVDASGASSITGHELVAKYNEFWDKSKELDESLPGAFNVLDRGPDAHRYYLKISVLREDCEELLALLTQFHPVHTVGTLNDSSIEQLTQRHDQIKKLLVHLDSLEVGF